MKWEHVGAMFAVITAMFVFLKTYLPPSYAKEAEIAKAKASGSMSAEDVMRIIRDNNKEVLSQILGVIKESFSRLEATDEKIAEAIRHQVLAMIEMGNKFQHREQITESMHRAGHEHMTRIEGNQKAIIDRMDDIKITFMGK
jgi:hypothetical protein